MTEHELLCELASTLLDWLQEDGDFPQSPAEVRIARIGHELRQRRPIKVRCTCEDCMTGDDWG